MLLDAADVELRLLPLGLEHVRHRQRQRNVILEEVLSRAHVQKKARTALALRGEPSRAIDGGGLEGRRRQGRHGYVAGPAPRIDRPRAGVAEVRRVDLLVEEVGIEVRLERAAEG